MARVEKAVARVGVGARLLQGLDEALDVGGPGGDQGQAVLRVKENFAVGSEAQENDAVEEDREGHAQADGGVELASALGRCDDDGEQDEAAKDSVGEVEKFPAHASVALGGVKAGCDEGGEHRQRDAQVGQRHVAKAVGSLNREPVIERLGHGDEVKGSGNEPCDGREGREPSCKANAKQPGAGARGAKKQYKGNRVGKERDDAQGVPGALNVVLKYGLREDRGDR